MAWRASTWRWTQAFDLLILDVMLPGRSGWEILASVRRMSQTPVLF